MRGDRNGNRVRWAIIGPGAIAANFAQGLAEADSGVLDAIASRDAGRRAGFGDRFGVAPGRRFDSYDAVFGDPGVDAVYIAVPHPFHADLAIRALRAGKHVLVEKPAGLIPGEVVAMTEVAAQEGRFLMEGMMYRCHPQIARMVEIIRAGEIGAVRHVEARFGFGSSHDPASRLDDPALGGGAILDVGVYPMSLARLVAGAALGRDVAEPTRIEGLGLLNPEGADETSHALMTFEGGIVAEIAASTRREMPHAATITGSLGRIVIDNPWVPGRNAGPSDAVLRVETANGTRDEVLADPRILFAHEAEAASVAIRAGRTEAAPPAPTWADSIGNARAIAAWRHAVGYALPGETVAGIRRLAGTLPRGLPQIPRVALDGMAGEIGSLILGCDNRDTLDEGAIVWDAWWEAGGNGFDTGFVYGAGRHEAVLGQWLKARGLGDAARVIVKGAHSPYCVPDAIRVQLEISLDRLGLDHAPVYILHRDNPQVPVGEFVDVLNQLHSEGLIGAFGGSNWSVGRFRKAAGHARANGMRPMTILNNNLSLAVMERPVWAGCVTSNTAQTLAFLRSGGAVHLSWSAQARGYFLDPGQGTALSADTAPDVCFASPANAERLRRARTLAAERGVAAHNVATAWVLGQGFPSLALIGPRSPGEIASTLPALTLRLSPADLAWLNLEADSR